MQPDVEAASLHGGDDATAGGHDRTGRLPVDGARAARVGRLVAMQRSLLTTPLVDQAVSVTLRGASAAGKFALSLYLLAYIGLAELGVFGLLVAVTTSIAAVLGFGLGDWAARQMIGVPRSRAVPVAATRLVFSVAVEAIVQPTFWIANALAGEPIPSQYALLVAPILLLEHLGTDAHAPLIARGRIKLVAVLNFIRAGLWPFAIIAVGLAFPAARSLTWILAAWLAGLVVMMAVLTVFAMSDGRWRCIRLNLSWLRDALTRCWPFYLSDIGLFGSLYADRFVISAFAGLELTGVYVFFWSAAYVVHSVSVYGTFHPRVPYLVEAARAGDVGTFRKRMVSCQTATMIWSLALSVPLWVAVDLFVHIADRPLMLENFGLFFWVIAAMLLRVIADSYHWVLYALHRDKEIAAVNVAGAAGSALINAVLVSALGLVGAVLASFAIGLALLAARYRFALRSLQADRSGAAGARS